MSEHRFWKADSDEDRNVVLHFDCGPDTRQNTLKSEALKQLSDTMDILLGKCHDVNSVVIVSAKPDSFCAGADIGEIKALADDSTAVGNFLDEAHQLLLKIRRAPFPIVAAVSGECLGGGLELAMICHGRVAADTPRTRFALPETSLGIIPGFGGTQMLPRLVGLQKALEVIVGQKKLSAGDALRCQLVDRLVMPTELVSEAKKLAQSIRGRDKDRWVRRGVEHLPILGNAIVLSLARKRVLKETHGNYPALLYALDSVSQFVRPLEAGLRTEKEKFLNCLNTDQAKNLMDVFFLRKEARSRKWVDHPPVECPKCVGVLGAGVMGRGIAYAVLSANVPVVLYDPYPQAIHAAVLFIEKLLMKEVKRGKLTVEQATKRRNLLTAVWGPSLQPLAKTDFVIEAVLEDVEVKHKVLAELDKQLGRDVVVATNTSSLLPSDIAKGFPRPEYFCAMHFFNPAHVMDLVEIAGHPGTSPYAIARTLALTKAMNKTPVVLKKECSGLIVNRILIQYLAWGLFFSLQKNSSAVNPWNLDRAFERMGMMMGPLKTVDLIGFDIGQHVMELTAKYYPGHLPEMSELPNLLTDKTTLGQKTGKGFYLWQNNKPFKPNTDILNFARSFMSFDDEWNRMVAGAIMGKMKNEANELIAEGVTDADMIDLSMILGAGFSPGRRGLLGRV